MNYEKAADLQDRQLTEIEAYAYFVWRGLERRICVI